MQDKTVPTVKKSDIVRYDLRNEYPYWWATICISKDGMLFIQSDYGDWSFSWNAFGNNFKKFLAGIGRDYLFNKLGGLDKEFNLDETIKRMKKEIIKERRAREIDDYVARDAFRELENFEDCSLDQFQLLWWQGHNKNLSLIFEDPYHIPIVKEDEYGLTAFYEKIWSVFIETLKKELELDPNEFNRS